MQTENTILPRVAENLRCVRGADSVVLMTQEDFFADRSDLPLVVIPSLTPPLLTATRTHLAQLEGAARVRLFTDQSADDDIAARRMQGAEVAIMYGIHFSEALLERVSHSVRCLVFGGTGVASYVDLMAARRLGVEVRNIVHYGDSSVAEHAVALLFEVARQVGRQDASMKRGEWAGIEGMDLGGKRLGVVGFGGVGPRLAAMAAGLGMIVSVTARERHREEIEASGFRYEPDVTALFSQSDVVSLHVGLTDETRGYVTRRHLEAMQPGAILINTARSEIIETGALEAVLQSGRIRAGLDVFDTEPLPTGDILRSLPNVVLTPHVAWYSDTAVDAIVEQCNTVTTAFLRGTPLNVMY